MDLMVKKGMISRAAVGIAQQFPMDPNGNIHSRIQIGNGANDYVEVRRVLDAERTKGSQHAKTQYIITAPDGKTQIPVESEDEGTSQIINLIQALNAQKRN